MHTFMSRMQMPCNALQTNSRIGIRNCKGIIKSEKDEVQEENNSLKKHIAELDTEIESKLTD